MGISFRSLSMGRNTGRAPWRAARFNENRCRERRRAVAVAIGASRDRRRYRVDRKNSKENPDSASSYTKP